jgi:hypothetical protein
LTVAELNMLKPRPVTMAVMRACEAMPDSRLVTTIPVGELIQFAEALFAAAPACGVRVPVAPQSEGGNG